MRLLPLIALVGLVPTIAFGQSRSQAAATPGTVSRKVDQTKVRIDQNLGAQVPLDATFTERTGKTVTFGELLGGKPALILPIFYKCKGVCGLELQGAIGALKGMKERKLGRDFNVLVVSIHPKETSDLAQGKFESTVKDLGLPGTEPGWRFVVGDWQNIHKVTDTVGFRYTYDERRDAIDHPSGVMFVTPKGVVSSYIYGATYAPAQFEHNFLLASKSKVGEKVQELFFGCVHVDPLTGKRSIVITQVLKVMGVATLLALGLSILVWSGKAQLKRRRG